MPFSKRLPTEDPVEVVQQTRRRMGGTSYKTDVTKVNTTRVSFNTLQNVPVTANLFAWYDASNVNRPGATNLLTWNQGSTCEDGTTTGFGSISANSTVNSGVLAGTGAVTTQAAYGNYSLAGGCITTAGNFRFGLSVSTYIPVIAGNTYTALASIRAATTIRQARVVIRWIDSTFTEIDPVVGGTYANNSTSAWTDYSVTATAPSNAVYGRLYVEIANAVVGEIHYADKFGLFNGTVTSWSPPAFPTQTSTDGDAVAYWADLSGNYRDLAQSTASYKPLFRNASRNLLTYNQGATCENGTTTGFPFVQNCSTAASTSQSLYGSYSLAATCSPSGDVIFGSDSTTVTSGIVAGQTYTAFVSLRSTVSRVAQLDIRWRDSGSNIIGTSSSSSSSTSTSAWTQYSVTATAPAGAVYATFRVYIYSSLATEVHYADQFGLFNGTVSTWVAPVTLLNNLPTVQFDGNNDSLTSGTTYSNGVPYSVYVVAARDGIATGSNEQYLWSLRDAGKNGLRGLLSSPTSTTSTWSANVVAASGTPTTATTASSALGTPYVFTSIYSGTGLQLSNIAAGLNGTMTSNSSTALMTSASSQIYVGGLGLAGTISGRIFAVLIYSAAHDTTTRQSIERWLGARYGITVA
jgi:hypothetical protein